MAIIPSITDKCTGALLASAIGDALGWPNEFRANNTSKGAKGGDYFLEWSRRAGGRYWSHSEKILPGEYSDDTQLILAVARSIIAGDWETVFAKKELTFWLEYERGGGSAVKNAAKTLKSGALPWESNDSRNYFNAGGNGATMRILPHVIARANQYEVKELIAEVITDCIFTHGHPRAILGATCYAYALQVLLKKESILEFGELINAVINGTEQWGAFLNTIVSGDWIESASRRSGYDYYHVWSSQVTDMVEKLKYIGESLKKGLLVNDKDVLKRLECFDKTNGAGDVAILTSLYLASKYANNPALGVKTAAFSFGADTDTIASITGGLLGMLCGTAWIPTEWTLVQDYDCLINVAELLLSEDMKEDTKKIISKHKSQSNDWEATPIGKVRRLSTSVVPSGKSAEVIIQKLETLLGQTLYIKKYERKGKINCTANIAKQEAVQAVSNPSKTEYVVFSLNAQQLKELMANPLLKRITFGKILQIADVVMKGNTDYVAIANDLKVDKGVVELICKHLLTLPQSFDFSSVAVSRKSADFRSSELLEGNQHQERSTNKYK